MTIQPTEQLVQDVRKQIVEGETQAALNLLLDHFSAGPDEAYNEVTLLWARLSRLNRDERTGSITHDQSGALRAKLDGDILNFLRQIQSNMATVSSATPNVGQAPVQKARLRDQMAQYFDMGEIDDLCFDLNVDCENLPGAGKIAKIRELIEFMERNNRLRELIETCKRKRPFLSWEF